MSNLNKTLSLILLLLTPVLASGQKTTSNARRIFSGSAVPTQTCSPGPDFRDVYIRTTTNVWYDCTAAPATWTAVTSGGTPGNVVAPASSTDNAIARFDSTTGKLIQNSGVIIDDSNSVTGVLTVDSSAGYLIGGIYRINGIATDYTQIFDGDQVRAILLGGDADPVSYYNNGAHRFKNRADNATFGIFDSAGLVVTGLASSTSYGTATNCADSAGAAACGSAAAGSVVIDAAATSVVVSTTAVTANSQIMIQTDSSLGTRLSVTCNTQSSLVLGSPRVTARTTGTSFTVTIEAGPTTNPLCLSYTLTN